MNSVGSAVFNNLPLIFAVGVALGMAQKEKEVATLSAAIAFCVMNATINAMLKITGQILHDGRSQKRYARNNWLRYGIKSLQMGVFGGIIVGLAVAALHNRFYKIQLPTVLSFFGGTRFVPIISTVCICLSDPSVLRVAVSPDWNLRSRRSGTSSGYAGTLIYGVMERALIPFGRPRYSIYHSGRQPLAVRWK